MHTLILAIFITTINLLMDVRGKCVKPVYRYLTIFFLVAGIGYFIDGMKELKAAEISPYQRYIRSKEEGGFQITMRDDTKKKTKKELDKEFIAKCWEKSNYHFSEGCRCLKEAEEVSILFPDIPDFDKSKLCLANAVLALNPGTPIVRLISIALAIGGQYASLVMDEWNKFKFLMLQAKTHFEMEEHYVVLGQYHYELYFIEKAEAEKRKKK